MTKEGKLKELEQKLDKYRKEYAAVSDEWQRYCSPDLSHAIRQQNREHCKKLAKTKTDTVRDIRALEDEIRQLGGTV